MSDNASSIPGNASSNITTISTSFSKYSNESQLISSCVFYWIEFFGYFYVQTFICLIGFWLNIVCFVIFQKRYFRRVVHHFMAVLALVDALNLAIMFPQGLTRCSQGSNKYIAICNSSSFYKVRLWILYITTYFSFGLGNVMEFLSACIILVLTWERFQAMRGCYRVNIRPQSYTLKISIGLFLFSLLFNIPFFLNQQMIRISIERDYFNESINQTVFRNVSVIQTLHTNFGLSNFYYMYLWIRMGIFPIFITVILIALSLILIKVTHHYFHNYSQQIKQHQQDIQLHLLSQNSSPSATNLINKRQRIELNLTLLLILVILLFILGHLPQIFTFRHLYQLISTLCKNYKRVECCFDYKIYRMFALNISLFTNCTPFFIYFKFDRTFRRSFKEIFCCKMKCNDDNSDLILSQETFNLSGSHKNHTSKPLLQRTPVDFNKITSSSSKEHNVDSNEYAN